MTAYQRPVVEVPAFIDEEGRPITYGSRWPDGPPDEAYSVVSHPERFAPLHAVALALIEHLRAEFEVEVDESDDALEDLLRRPAGPISAVRVRPLDSDCAALTFALTDFPGVVVHAGAIHDLVFPVCGCDACDTTWQTEAAEIERHVFAVVAGGYRESIDAGPRPWIEEAWEFPDGRASGRAQAADLSRERLTRARRELSNGSGLERVLRGHGRAWAPWPRATRAT